MGNFSLFFFLTKFFSNFSFIFFYFEKLFKDVFCF